MIVISFGVPKSGSTLAFEMAKAVLELNGFAQPQLEHASADPNVNYVRDWSDHLLAALLAESEGKRIVVKTHRPPTLSKQLVLDAISTEELAVHVVFRDPRDTVVSMIDEAVRTPLLRTGELLVPTLDYGIQRLGRQLPHLRAWGTYSSLKLRYEEFAFDPVFGPKTIADHLGVAAEPDAVWELVRRRFTQRNVAVPHRHRTDLWPHEVERIERAFPLFLDVVRGEPPAGWFELPAS